MYRQRESDRDSRTSLWSEKPDIFEFRAHLCVQTTTNDVANSRTGRRASREVSSAAGLGRLDIGELLRNRKPVARGVVA